MLKKIFNSTTYKWSNWFFLGILAVVTLKFFSLLIVQHIELINHPYQIEFREGAQLNFVWGLERGLNPYKLENQPWLADNFGVIYPSVSWIIAKFTGLNLFTLRLVSALSILLSSALLFIAMKREKINLIINLSGITIFYACCLYYVTPTGRPDALALLFFLCSCFIPIFYRFSNRSLLFGILFSILSFYTKQYSILGFAAILFYVFLFVSIRKSIQFGLLFFTTLIISMFVISHYFECYFYNTTVGMAIAAGYNNMAYSIMQLNTLFFKYLLGLTIFSLIAGIFLVYQRVRNSSLGNFKIQFNFQNFSGPLLLKRINPYVFISICMFLILLIRLGGNEGTFMTYHMQLLAFSLIIIALKLNVYLEEFSFVSVPFIAYCLYSTTILITSSGHFKKENSADWEKIKSIIASNTSQLILTDESIAAEMVYAKKQPYMTGLNGYFNYSTLNENFNSKFPFTTQLKERADYFRKMEKENIVNQKFDYIILEKDHWSAKDALIKQYYTLVDSVTLNMYYTDQDWKLKIWSPTKKES
jgi:hypothetical protein